jgi:hypothetical protein
METLFEVALIMGILVWARDMDARNIRGNKAEIFITVICL